jgi:CarD family transcriptional regulator
MIIYDKMSLLHASDTRLLMFRVNEKVIHPKFGACKIAKIVEKHILGTTERCLVLVPLFENPTHLTITIPLRSVDEVGVRQPLDEETISRVKNLLLSVPDNETLKKHTSTPYVREKIHSGEVIKVAEALRDLFFKNRVENGKYSNVNRRTMYKKAFKMLSNELAISQEISVDQATAWITDNLQKHDKYFREQN